MDEKTVKALDFEASGESVRKMAEGLSLWVEGFVEVWQNVCAGIQRAWDAVVGSVDVTFICAYAWATVHHPDWVKILNRTKKKRTRKKYQDRILRAYLKER